jgi:hypothetical protein
MEAPFNTTMTRSPEMILASVNLYLDQFEPLRVIYITMATSAILYRLFPRLNYAAVTLILSLVCTELLRAYQRDYETMDSTLSAWYSVGFAAAFGPLIYYSVHTFA